MIVNNKVILRCIIVFLSSIFSCTSNRRFDDDFSTSFNCKDYTYGCVAIANMERYFLTEMLESD
jgi:hypothetical protein